MDKKKIVNEMISEKEELMFRREVGLRYIQRKNIADPKGGVMLAIGRIQKEIENDKKYIDFLKEIKDEY